jgi:hypothetical protein
MGVGGEGGSDLGDFYSRDRTKVAEKEVLFVVVGEDRVGRLRGEWLMRRIVFVKGHLKFISPVIVELDF